MLFGRYWLHAATERALTDRAGLEAPVLSSPMAILTMAILTMGLEVREQPHCRGCTCYGFCRYGRTRTKARLTTALESAPP